MTICRCDKCGTEIPKMEDVFIVQFGMWSSPLVKPRTYDLCQKCAEELEQAVKK